MKASGSQLREEKVECASDTQSIKTATLNFSSSDSTVPQLTVSCLFFFDQNAGRGEGNASPKFLLQRGGLHAQPMARPKQVAFNIVRG